MITNLLLSCDPVIITHSRKILSCLLENTTASNKFSLPIKITTEISHTNLKNGPDGSRVMEEKYTELSNTRDKKATKLTTSA
jgi:hypothetical protein